MNHCGHDESARDYDRLAQEYGWRPEAVFHLCREFCKPGERLLDLGIGTGLASAPFARAGLEVSGVDFSDEMLALCRSRGTAADLRCLDLLQEPWPYPDASFDHVIACGLLHFFSTLDEVFRQTARVLREGGSFAFTTKRAGSSNEAGDAQYTLETIDGVSIYAHDDTYVEGILAVHGFRLEKKSATVVKRGIMAGMDVYRIWVTRKYTTAQAGR